MGEIKSILNKFNKTQEDLKAIATELVDKYPNSKRLVDMVTEINSALTALFTLENSLSEALTEAETDQKLLEDLLAQMEQADLYSNLTAEEQKNIAEYLVQNKQSLATPESLETYIQKNLMEKPSSNLISMYPKAWLVEKGKKIDDGSDGFDAYSAGLKDLKTKFDEDKAKVVKELAKIWFEKDPEAMLHEFYAEALKES